MFDDKQDMDHDQELKDKVLAALLDHIEDVIGGSMKPDQERDGGMAVQVQAPDKEHLVDGLEKAKELASEASDHEKAEQEDEGAEQPSGEEKSDEDRLMELLDSDEDEDKEDEDKKNRR